MNERPCASPCPFILERVLSVIGFNDSWSVNLVSWFPGVIRFRVSLPFDEVLEGSGPAGVSMIDHFFDFVFLFTFDKVRGWPGIVGPVCVGFAIGG